ncbi:hypothetical protein SAMN04488543_0463 [Friedmanniella luteola]|uniref:Nucleotidyltransferase domain-containing protein n=1 Tax=Friedmanniella luteola TaxID=546871 RepID=A0A1H1LVU6_9ACTN|nr:hypothetical protein [Friedmanniella luteola]SDR78633.1 hypothetical protein SAMN04488543_0463 [Friedmanniella luteola]
MNRPWQRALADELTGRLGPRAAVAVAGSVRRPATLDGWSDLDLHLRLADDADLAELVAPAEVWAHDLAATADEQVVRLVLRDGRRVDLQVRGAGRLRVDAPDEQAQARFVAAMVAVKTGRGDRLIATHLLLGLLRTVLVDGLRLRDRDEGTTVHRTGTARDALATEVATAAALPLEEGLAAARALLDRGWAELLPAHVPDWSGLDALLSRGRAPSP